MPQAGLALMWLREATHKKELRVMTQDASKDRVKVIAVKHSSEDLRQIKKVQQMLLMSAGVRSEMKIEILPMRLIEQRRQVPHVQ